MGRRPLGAELAARGAHSRVEAVHRTATRAGEDKPGAAAVVILGHGIWKTRYGGDAGILGRTIRVNEARKKAMAGKVGVPP